MNVYPGLLVARFGTRWHIVWAARTNNAQAPWWHEAVSLGFRLTTTGRGGRLLVVPHAPPRAAPVSRRCVWRRRAGSACFTHPTPAALAPPSPAAWRTALRGSLDERRARRPANPWGVRVAVALGAGRGAVVRRVFYCATNEPKAEPNLVEFCATYLIRWCEHTTKPKPKPKPTKGTVSPALLCSEWLSGPRLAARVARFGRRRGII